MPPVDAGRASHAAPIPEDLDLPGLAFEFLRRNPAYVRDARKRHPGRHGEQTAEIAHRWGLRFRPRSRTTGAT